MFLGQIAVVPIFPKVTRIEFFLSHGQLLIVLYYLQEFKLFSIVPIASLNCTYSFVMTKDMSDHLNIPNTSSHENMGLYLLFHWQLLLTTDRIDHWNIPHHCIQYLKHHQMLLSTEVGWHHRGQYRLENKCRKFYWTNTSLMISKCMVHY